MIGIERTWDVLEWIDEGERQVGWWARYADRLTPDERKRIRDGDYRALRRVLPPAFSAGDWLEVAPNLEVHIAAVEPRKGIWRIVIDRVQDFRSEPLMSHRRLTEKLDPAVVTTLDIGSEPVNQPEPGIVPHELVRNGPTAIAARERYAEEQRRRRVEHRDLPLELRLANLRRIARAKHIDISSEERVIERRLAKLEERLVDDAA